MGEDLTIYLSKKDLARLSGLRQKQPISGLRVKQKGKNKLIRDILIDLDDYKYFRDSNNNKPIIVLTPMKNQFEIFERLQKNQERIDAAKSFWNVKSAKEVELELKEKELNG